MEDNKLIGAFARAAVEMPNIGINSGERIEPSLDQARGELASSVSKALNNCLGERYGPLSISLSELAIEEILKEFEANLARVKSDLTLVKLEILDRAW